jgi:hypothetical protein
MVWELAEMATGVGVVWLGAGYWVFAGLKVVKPVVI